ncbi:hypothetical protein NC651_026316 [Populus alba x Populus x berolinensis]|nr:hypothetical protein NC651_026316 [Populus alba x Populus x berolinensis]
MDAKLVRKERELTCEPGFFSPHCLRSSAVLSCICSFRFVLLPFLFSPSPPFCFSSHSNERMKESNSLCSRVTEREGWLLLILLLRLRKEMVAEEAPDGRVAQLVSGCCWCWPWFSRGGAASCWDFSREAVLRFRCCFFVTVGGRAGCSF